MASPSPVPLQERLAALLAAIFLFQTSLVGTVLIFSAAPLLLVPKAEARRIFQSISGAVVGSWLGMAVGLLRYGLGIQILFHAGSGIDWKDVLPLTGDLLLVSNHPTRLDWMFLWSLGVVANRLMGFKVVVKAGLRSVPGFGWAMQLAAFPFMSRKDKDVDLQTLRDVCILHGGKSPAMALLFFPEGTDLSESNLRKSWEFSEKNKLPRYEQVLLPRTAGFVECSSALVSTAEARRSPPPSLLNVDVAYVDWVPGRLPSEASLFGRGEAPKEVHVYVENLGPIKGGEAELVTLCTALFAKKEARCKKFYKPCGDRYSAAGLTGALPDVSAFGTSPTPLEHMPDALQRLLKCAAVWVALDVAAAWLACRCGLVQSLLVFLAACVSVALAGTATGGLDQAIIQHLLQYPDGLSKSD